MTFQPTVLKGKQGKCAGSTPVIHSFVRDIFTIEPVGKGQTFHQAKFHKLLFLLAYGLDTDTRRGLENE
jgi:hypothetical protein